MLTVIVEDEEPNSSALSSMLHEYCPSVKNLAVFTNIKEAENGIIKLKPDLIFLDIVLGNENGFDLLKTLPDPLPKIIFTTAFNEYALRAIKVSAVDYLLKPISIKELQDAVEKAARAIDHNKHLHAFKQNIFSSNNKLHKIALPTSDGHIFAEISDIISLKADGSYTHINLVKKQSILVSKQLKEYEYMLDGENFFRVHHSHIVNVEHIAKYIRGSGGYLVMSDGSTIDVAMRRKEDLLQRLRIH